MNHTDDNLQTIDEGVFDLLVDGELSEAQRRDVLARLEHVPDGWRRCALAFLEAQCWSEEFRAIPRQATSRAKAGPAALRWMLGGGKGRTLLAMAASFLVALGLGLLLPSAWRGGERASPGARIATTEVPQGAAPKPKPPGVAPRGSLAEAAGSSSQWQYVPVPVARGPQGFGGSIRLPAVQRESIDEAWLESLPAAIPAEVLEALRRTGHQVSQQRSWVPFSMEDGRHLVVPYDQVEIRFVGNSAYQ